MTQQSTPDRILDVATHLFIERGFANVSIRSICEEAGVTPPTIYHHYHNKEGLFQAVVQRKLSLDEFRERLTRAVQPYDDPEQQLLAFIRTYLSSFPETVLNAGLFYQDSTELYDLSLSRFNEEVDAVHAIARRILSAGVEAGVFRDVDLDDATTCLLGMLGGFITNETYLKRSFDPDEVGRLVYDLALNGLGDASDRRTT